MASSSTEVNFPVADDFSLERVKDHLSLMRRFQGILSDVKSPITNADHFPQLPEGATGTDVNEKWRVQAYLMSAEVRYGLYLRFLHEWVVDNPERSKNKATWPLPPWDVAIIFYAHLLMPQRFHQEIAASFPDLWSAKIEFPLARLVRNPPASDVASEAKWHMKYPDVPYQVVAFDSKGCGGGGGCGGGCGGFRVTLEVLRWIL